MKRSNRKSVSGDKVVIHVRDGKILRGRLIDFSQEDNRVQIDVEAESSEGPGEIKISDLKAIYFVRSLTGNKAYRRKRYFQLPNKKGHRIMIRFKDGEILCGFIEGDFPWEGGFLKSNHSDPKGFYMFPADPDGNNMKIFIVVAAAEDIRQL